MADQKNESTINTNKNDVSGWWQTSIIDMSPGKIAIRGIPIENLIGNIGFMEMIWIMLRKDRPSDYLPSPLNEKLNKPLTDDRSLDDFSTQNDNEEKTKIRLHLLEAAMVAAVDHGPQAPSIATARMAMTCGASLNNALASAVNMLDDVHGGAGQQAVQWFYLIHSKWQSTTDVTQRQELIEESIKNYQQEHGQYLPGFGHRFHTPTDPRAVRLLQLLNDAQQRQAIGGDFIAIGEAIEATINKNRTKKIPLNIDGITAIIYAELGFEAQLARGLFCLSRSVGILAHAWEQSQQGGRNKGPTPPQYRWKYQP